MRAKLRPTAAASCLYCFVFSHVVVAAAVAFAASVTSPSNSKHIYLGCFQDDVVVMKRALPNVMLPFQESLTHEQCFSECDQRGFAFSGLEWSKECYCGAARPPAALRIAESRCDSKCIGDGSQICGGSLALSVYEHTPPLPPPPPSTRCLLSLIMIVKDEQHTILDTLRTVAGVIDRWFILDTGSTDGTQTAITKFMATTSVQGKLFEEPFVDYGATRNRVMDLAKDTEPCVFTLMLSADEQVTNPTDMRRFLETQRWSEGPAHNAYPVVMNSGIDFDSVRIARTDGMWRYVGRVHEYLTSPKKEWVDLYRPSPEIRVQFKATDEDRRFKSQWSILRLLKQDLALNYNDTRSIFYIARTLSVLRNHTGSFHYYEMLQQRSQWDEEVYHAKICMYLESRSFPKQEALTWQQQHAILFDAFESKPDDMDAVHLMAEDHFNAGRYHLAYVWAQHGASIKRPNGLKKVQNVLLRNTEYLYEWEGDRLLGFAASRVGKVKECVRAFDRMLQKRPADIVARHHRDACQSALLVQASDEDHTSLKAKPVLDIPAFFLPATQKNRGHPVVPQSHHDTLEHHHNIVKTALAITWCLNMFVVLVFRKALFAACCAKHRDSHQHHLRYE